MTDPSDQAQEIRDAWNLFQVRKALLTDQALGFSFHHINSSMHMPEIQRATSSLLYINLLSILDDATATQMDSKKWTKLGKLNARLEHLESVGKLIDPSALHTIRRRRNELGHEFGKDATVAQLEDAITNVREQLLAWQLIADHPPYVLKYERSGSRDSSDPKILFEQDHKIQVMRGDQVMAEAIQTISFFKHEIDD